VTQNITEITDDTTYQIVYVDGKALFVYEGQIYSIKYDSNGETTSKAGEMGSYAQGTGDAHNMRVYGEKGTEHRLDGYYSFNDITDYYTGQDFDASDNEKDDTYTYIGYGEFSSLTLKEGTTHSAKQFRVKDGNDVRYVYCVELDAGLDAGDLYGVESYQKGSETNNQKVFTKGGGSVAQVRSVALNGYWGNKNGMGSLEAVKDLMIRNGLAAEAQLLTEGHALTATQEAIWEFGNRKTGDVNLNVDANTIKDTAAEVTGSVSAAKVDAHGTQILDANGNPITDQTIVNKLSDLLIGLANNAEGEGKAEVINENNFKGATITLKEETETAGVYDADVTFTLDVTTSSLNGDMIVQVIQDGVVVGSARLAGNGKTSGVENSGKEFGKIYPDANGTYTLTGLELTNGVPFDLQLSGVQHLDGTVQIFRNGAAGTNNKGNQDFVGLDITKKDMKLTVNMGFTVTDPDAEFSVDNKQSSREREASWTETLIVNHDQERTVTTTDSVTGQTDEFNTTVNEVFGTITITETSTDRTSMASTWWNTSSTDFEVTPPPQNNPPQNNPPQNNPPEEFEEIPEEEPPLEDMPEEDVPLEDIFDEEIPLASVPATGDNTALWIFFTGLCALALAAVALMSRKTKKN